MNECYYFFILNRYCTHFVPIFKLIDQKKVKSEISNCSFIIECKPATFNTNLILKFFEGLKALVVKSKGDET